MNPETAERDTGALVKVLNVLEANTPEQADEIAAAWQDFKRLRDALEAARDREGEMKRQTDAMLSTTAWCGEEDGRMTLSVDLEAWNRWLDTIKAERESGTTDEGREG